jgi:hypothetical protein
MQESQGVGGSRVRKAKVAVRCCAGRECAVTGTGLQRTEDRRSTRENKPTPCVSCVTRHGSHVMCHMSCVTCYVSHVMCHMSRIICHFFYL